MDELYQLTGESMQLHEFQQSMLTQGQIMDQWDIIEPQNKITLLQQVDT